MLCWLTVILAAHLTFRVHVTTALLTLAHVLKISLQVGIADSKSEDHYLDIKLVSEKQGIKSKFRRVPLHRMLIDLKLYI